MKLYEYAVIKDEKKDKEGNKTEDAELVVPVTTVLANSDEQAQMIASRAIPDDHMDDLDRLIVVVRPF